jgi:nucleoside-diphosphate kinase
VTTLERTLVVLKPDAVARGFVGRVIQRFEDAGLKIVGVKMAWLDDDMTRRHYFDLEERYGRAIYDANARAMRRGPVIAMVLEGVEAVTNVRRMVGPTYPNEAAPGTIRGDFAHQSKARANTENKGVANLVHASGSVDEAKYEVELWFGAPGEQFDYHTLAETYTF